jgi:hypothetical protein
MTDLLWPPFLLIGPIFVWSGFVRFGLGFGGALPALPFRPLIVNEPPVLPPLVAAPHARNRYIRIFRFLTRHFAR